MKNIRNILIALVTFCLYVLTHPINQVYAQDSKIVTGTSAPYLFAGCGLVALVALAIILSKKKDKKGNKKE